MRQKVTVVGGGFVGSTLAQRLVEKGYMDVVLVDVVPDMPQGKALDMLQSGPILGFDSRITGVSPKAQGEPTDYLPTANSDVVVITAGVARKPGMSRDDLLLTNKKIVGDVTEQVAKYSPKATLIVISNPLDAMVQMAYHVSKFPKNRVVGMAGILDTARFRTFLATELKVSVEDVQAYVLGSHGDTMVPLVRYTSVGGIPVTELLPKDKLDAIVKRTRDGGAEIVSLLKTGSAYYAPSAAGAEMVESILLDKKRIQPCCVYLDGEFGVKGYFMGVPVKLGAEGVEKIFEVKLTPEEQGMFNAAVDSVKELVKVMGI